MDYVKLKAKLLEGHPVTGAFDAVAAVAAAQFNVVNRTRIRESMSGDEAFQQTDKVGFAGLTEEKKQLWLAFCGRDQINPSEGANIDFVKWVFGDTSKTVINLNAARTEQISWAVELGLGTIAPGDVENARYGS